jgi:hypothetical protein
MGTFAFGKRGSDGLSMREGFLGLRDRVFFAKKKCRHLKKKKKKNTDRVRRGISNRVENTEQKRERPNGEVEEFLCSNCKRSLLVCPIERESFSASFEEETEYVLCSLQVKWLSGCFSGEKVERWRCVRRRNGGGGNVASPCLFWFSGFGDGSGFLLREIETIGCGM